MKPITIQRGATKSVLDRTTILLKAAILGAALVSCVSVTQAQAYGVARRTTVAQGPNGTVAASRTTVASGPNGTVAATRTVVGNGGHAVGGSAVVVSGNNVNTVNRSTVVVAGGGMPHGYVAVMPTGYRMVTVSGARYYTVGGVYYRPQMYQGRTVYVAVRL
jgi:hypothetical protein